MTSGHTQENHTQENKIMKTVEYKGSIYVEAGSLDGLAKSLVAKHKLPFALLLTHLALEFNNYGRESYGIYKSLTKPIVNKNKKVNNRKEDFDRFIPFEGSHWAKDIQSEIEFISGKLFGKGAKSHVAFLAKVLEAGGQKGLADKVREYETKYW